MPRTSELPDGIFSDALPTEKNLFADLFASVDWEDVGKGRRGAVLTKVDAEGGVPLVRTTTRYGTPAQRFRPLHDQLAHHIQERMAFAVGFNNALIETYTNAYTTMGGHSDQALDLADGTHIAVFSCYEHAEAGPPRKLIFESKDADDERFEIPLVHNNVVAFSVATNRRFRHKIVLDAPDRTTDNPWLGVTFRTSKTIIHFRDGRPFLPDAAPLTQADDDQQREFYQLRRRENKETDFTYPHLTYTISESDLHPPA